MQASTPVRRSSADFRRRILPPRIRSRRGFLLQCGALASAPFVIPASALGRGQPAPSERITLGLIGCGGRGSGLGGLFLGFSACRCVAVCDVDAERRDRAKAQVDKKYGATDCAACTDFREVLARDDIDAVVIASTEHWHGVQAVMACRAGKDVYCEKPLALTIPEARAIAGAGRRYARIVQAGSQSRSITPIRFGCEVVRRGRIGKVTEVHASCHGPSGPSRFKPEPVPQGLDWDLYLGPAPWQPYNKSIHPGRGWMYVRDLGGGGMTDWGAHHFDIAQWGLGMDDSGPVEVFPPGHLGRKNVSFRYANGVMLYHDPNWPTSGVTFVGAEGRVSIHGLSLRVEFAPEALAAELRLEMKTALAGADINKNHVENFLDCVRTRAKPNADAEIGCRSVTVCHLGNIGYWLRRPLKWDPVKEEFVGDEEANRWLGRAMRAPWRV
jgi:predicted dehydrogenase